MDSWWTTGSKVCEELYHNGGGSMETPWQEKDDPRKDQMPIQVKDGATLRLTEKPYSRSKPYV